MGGLSSIAYTIRCESLIRSLTQMQHYWFSYENMQGRVAWDEASLICKNDYALKTASQIVLNFHLVQADPRAIVCYIATFQSHLSFHYCKNVQTNLFWLFYIERFYWQFFWLHRTLRWMRVESTYWQIFSCPALISKNIKLFGSSMIIIKSMMRMTFSSKDSLSVIQKDPV